VIKVLIVIPAFNEEKNIALVIEKVTSIVTPYNIIIIPLVINDASIDGTAEVVLKNNCMLINLPVNLGIGGVVQTGFKYALYNGYDYAIQFDGDGQHPADKIVDLIEVALQGYDVVIGSRFIENKGYRSTFLRRIGIWYFKYIIKIFCGITIYDCTSGFRILNRKALEIVSEFYPDDYPEPVSIVLYKQKQLKIKEIPVIMYERIEGKSSIRAFNTIYYMIKVTLGLFFTFFRAIKNRN